MINYNNIVSFKKSSIIFIEDKYPKKSFYIITKGKAISYANNSKFYDREYNIGFIIGLVNLATNEPYFISIKAVEEVELIEINLSDIKNLTNNDLIKKIYEYLNNTLSKSYISIYPILVNDKKLNHALWALKLSAYYDLNVFKNNASIMPEQTYNDILKENSGVKNIYNNMSNNENIFISFIENIKQKIGIKK